MSEPSDAEDPLADFEAGQRKRRLIGLGVAVAAVAVVGAGWAWWRATGLPPLDPEAKKEISEAMDTLDTLPREYHSMLAAQAMAELEGERLPAAMVEAFDDAKSVPPDMVSLVLMRPFAEDVDSLEAWTVACPAGADAIAEVAQTGDVNTLFADCDLGRWSLIDGTAAQRLSAGRLILAHAAWGWLVEHHSETELERRVLRVFVQG
ncbi:hypothetical protein [Enhygromyxa salina]|uniref:Uncharacterized protein n=1 Tax=Enhygromyxa salina TaxID=215803 RepID=A0A2S9YM54_9BACT|nr:hypothetical protein [Enhygromyxa salina]PRQ06142.1 hypothetical protein ENSA7_41760 [Enhygromyxa salina]